MENIEAMLCAYVEGDLDETGRAQIEKHLASHPNHRKLLNDLVEMREMVRSLPRVKAPGDVGDSLRQKVERSMLLEDAAAVAPMGGRPADRWPQVFAIAAMFLLVSALCFIVYRALAPTMKPAVFTQAPAGVAASPRDDAKLDAGSASSDRMLRSDLMVSKPADKVQSAQTPMGLATPQNSNAQASQWGSANQTSMANQAQQFVMQVQQQVAYAQVDLEALRRRLMNGGYSIDQAANNKTAPATLMVVNSKDIPATKQQITQFLNSSGGISWNSVPEDVENPAQSKNAPAGASGAANIAANGGGSTANNAANPVGGTPGGGVGQMDAATPSNSGAAMQPMVLGDAGGARQNAIFKAVTTQPSSDLFVARGLTPMQVDALKQTLSVPQNGQATEVTVQSVEGLPTTQPSIAMPSGVNAMGLAAAPPTSRPTETANATLDMSMPATTLPSDGADQKEGPASALAANSGPLQQVDAVIVVQSSSATPLGTGAATTQREPQVQAAGNVQTGNGAAGNTAAPIVRAATEPSEMAAPATQP